MPRERADEIVTIRMPKGSAARLRALTGQPFSRLVRWTMLAFLEKYEAKAANERNTYNDLKTTVKELPNDKSS